MNQKRIQHRPSKWKGLAGYGLLWVFALAVRGIYLWQIKDADVFTLLMGDAVSYDTWAQKIAGGDWFGHGVFYQAPLYPYFMGVVYAVFGKSFLALRLVQSVIGATSCVLLARAGKSFFSKNIGWLAGALLAVCPIAIFYDGSIQKSVLDSFFVCALLAILGRLHERVEGRWWAAVGAVLGLLALTRENALIFLPVILLWLFVAWNREPWVKRFRWAGMLLLGLGIVLLPVACRNRFVGGEFHLTTSQSGSNFYIGNNRNAEGFYNPLVWGHGSAKFERDDATVLAEQALGRTLSAGEVSHYWTMKALGEIQENPPRWLKLLVWKWLLVWNASEAGDTDDPNTYGEWSALLKILSHVLNFGIICPLAVLGICLTWSRRKKLWLLYLMVLIYAASVALFYVFSRYRFPLTPMLLLFAAGGLKNVHAALRERPAKRAIIGIATTMIVAVICNRPAVAQNDTRGVTHYNIAVNLVNQKGDFERALPHYFEAVRLKPDFAAAHHDLGVVLSKKGRTSEAISELLLAVRYRPDYPEAYNNLGAVMVSQGKLDDAIIYITKAVELNPDYAEAHYFLGLLLANQGKAGEAISHLQIATRLNPADARFSAALESVQKKNASPPETR